MLGTLPRPRDLNFPPLPLAALFVVAAGLNASLTLETVGDMMRQDTAGDWRVLSAAATHGVSPGLYEGRLYQWSPLLVPILQLLEPLGVTGWRVLHVVGALAMPTWTLRVLLLASWPFWFDFSVGNVLTLIALSAAWAIRGSMPASLAYLALTLLIPRPLVLPLAAWLLWRRPGVRLPFILLALAIGSLTVGTGLAGEWLSALMTSATSVGPWSAGGGGWDFNVGPSRVLGVWWLVIGIPVAVWLTLRGQVGLAGLAASPYWLPYYLMFAFLPVARSRNGIRYIRGRRSAAAWPTADVRVREPMDPR